MLGIVSESHLSSHGSVVRDLLHRRKKENVS
jgi:hypothetical protein